jgi:CubicO group peptidase (beta-lactamase class C family)
MSPGPRHTTQHAGRLPSIAFLLATAALLTPGRAAAQTDSAALLPAYRLIDRYVQQSMQEAGTPGLAMAITDRNGTLRVATFGYADLSAKRLVTSHDRFEIGSVSKSFTALALMQLAAEGKFDPKKPITASLPWFAIKTKYRPITGEDLLTHTAGFPADRDDIPSSQAQAYAVRDRTAGSVPGSYWSYSNVGFQVLGYALGHLAGKPSARVVQDRILTPLGMTESQGWWTHADRPSMVIGYSTQYDDRPNRAGEPLYSGTWLEYAGGDGAIISTAGDMAAYCRLLLNRGRGPNGQIVLEKWFAEFARPRALPDKSDMTTWYGYGIEVLSRHGHRQLAHTGGMIGYYTSLLADLDSGLGVIVLVNGPARPSSISRFALKVMEAERSGTPLPELPAAENPFDVENAGQLAGAFTTANGRRLVFEADSNRLYLVRSGGRTPLESAGTDAVLGPADSFPLFPLTFRRTKGVVTEVTYGGDWYTNEQYRGPKSFAYPKAWDAYAGHWRIAQDWEPNFRIIIRKGKLLYVSPGGEEQAMTPLPGGDFRVGDPQSAERLKFDQLVEGKALRASLSGMMYYRSFTP